MRATFSEFSYGYAVTQELANGSLGTILAAPVFPTLRSEGSFGGYDVQLPLEGAPLFLQFKLSDYLSMANAAEWDAFDGPYYRMHIRPLRYSNQHNLLLDWQRNGNATFYVAPTFHRVEELNDYYLDGRVSYESVFVHPEDIGDILDPDEHYVIFPRDCSHAYRCSKERKRLRKVFKGKGFAEYALNLLKRKKQKLEKETFRSIVFDLIDLTFMHPFPFPRLFFEHKLFRDGISVEDIEKSALAYTAALLTRLTLDAELYIKSYRNT